MSIKWTTGIHWRCISYSLHLTAVTLLQTIARSAGVALNDRLGTDYAISILYPSVYKPSNARIFLWSGSYNTFSYALYRVMMSRLLRGPLRSTDASNASVVFIPYDMGISSDSLTVLHIMIWCLWTYYDRGWCDDRQNFWEIQVGEDEYWSLCICKEGHFAPKVTNTYYAMQTMYLQFIFRV